MNSQAACYRNPVVRNCIGGGWACSIEPEAVLSGVHLQGSVFIGFGSYMNDGMIRGYGEIGRYCSVGRDVSIGLGIHALENTSTSPFFSLPASDPYSQFASRNPVRRAIVGNDVWIGDGVRINSGVRVGDGAVIATGAVVTKDVEPYSIVGGIPARFLKWRFEESVRTQLLELKWWQYEPQAVRSLMEADPEKSAKAIRDSLPILKPYPTSYSLIRPENLKVRWQRKSGTVAKSMFAALKKS